MYHPFLCISLALAAIIFNDHSSAWAEAQASVKQTPALVFSTYLGGSKPCDACTGANTFSQNTAVDANGNIYVTGATTVSDLPVLNASQQQPAQGSMMSAFVAKYDPTGNPLWCTYLGGNQQSMGVGIAAMPAGGVAVAGLTTSDTSVPFPTMNPYQPQLAGKSDYFVTVFDWSGNMLYSTYLGGSGAEGTPEPNTFDYDSNNGNNVAVDATGNVVQTGPTYSPDFPLKDPAQTWPGNAGGLNAFVAKFAGFSSPQQLIVPTMNFWGALLLFLTLAGASVWKIRSARRRRLG